MLKVITQLGNIPIGATVTKIAGSKEYVVRDRLTVYGEKGEPTLIYANNDCLYLIAKDGGIGSINAFGFDKELVWHTDLEELNLIAEGIPQ